MNPTPEDRREPPGTGPETSAQAVPDALSATPGPDPAEPDVQDARTAAQDDQDDQDDRDARDDRDDRDDRDAPVDRDATDPDAPRRGRRRDPLAATLIGVLTLLLGFAFAVQVRTTDEGTALAGAREEDLVRILDDLTGREDRLRQEIAEQRGLLDQLGSSDSQSAAALEEARERAEALGILNGTLPAQGPGIEMTIRDPSGRVPAAVLLDAVQELRGAGAETMQVDDVRVAVSTAVTGDPGDLEVDGRSVQPPYVFRVIGSPQDMATAMEIPNGVVDKVRLREGAVEIAEREQVVVDALRPLDTPQYAEPAAGD